MITGAIKKQLTRSSILRLNDGNTMPLIGLGTYQMKRGEVTTNAVVEALRQGYRHIDTGEIYNNESSIGDAIKIAEIPRNEVYITTKVFPGQPPKSKKYNDIIKSCENSLKKLDLDFVDMYVLNAPLDKEHRIEQYKALEELKNSGKARSIGVSNYGIHHLEEILDQCEFIPAINQLELTPYCQRQELCKFCIENEVALVAYSPLTRGKKLSDPKLVAIAQNYNTSTAQLLLRWCLQKGYAVIPKSTNSEHIRQNFDLFSFEITQEDMQKLNLFDENLTVAWPSDPTKVQ